MEHAPSGAVDRQYPEAASPAYVFGAAPKLRAKVVCCDRGAATERRFGDRKNLPIRQNAYFRESGRAQTDETVGFPPVGRIDRTFSVAFRLSGIRNRTDRLGFVGTEEPTGGLLYILRTDRNKAYSYFLKSVEADSNAYAMAWVARYLTDCMPSGKRYYGREGDYEITYFKKDGTEDSTQIVRDEAAFEHIRDSLYGVIRHLFIRAGEKGYASAYYDLAYFLGS